MAKHDVPPDTDPFYDVEPDELDRVVESVVEHPASQPNHEPPTPEEVMDAMNTLTRAWQPGQSPAESVPQILERNSTRLFPGMDFSPPSARSRGRSVGEIASEAVPDLPESLVPRTQQGIGPEAPATTGRTLRPSCEGAPPPPQRPRQRTRVSSVSLALPMAPIHAIGMASPPPPPPEGQTLVGSPPPPPPSASIPPPPSTQKLPTIPPPPRAPTGLAAVVPIADTDRESPTATGLFTPPPPPDEETHRDSVAFSERQTVAEHVDDPEGEHPTFRMPSARPMQGPVAPHPPRPPVHQESTGDIADAPLNTTATVTTRQHTLRHYLKLLGFAAIPLILGSTIVVLLWPRIMQVKQARTLATATYAIALPAVPSTTPDSATLPPAPLGFQWELIRTDTEYIAVPYVLVPDEARPGAQRPDLQDAWECPEDGQRHTLTTRALLPNGEEVLLYLLPGSCTRAIAP